MRKRHKKGEHLARDAVLSCISIRFSQADQLDTAVTAGFIIDIMNMLAKCGIGDVQLLADFHACFAMMQQLQDLKFTLGERIAVQDRA